MSQLSGQEFRLALDGESQEGGAEEADGGVGGEGGEGADGPPPSLRPQPSRLHGRQDQGGETAGEKCLLIQFYMIRSFCILEYLLHCYYFREGLKKSKKCVDPNTERVGGRGGSTQVWKIPHFFLPFSYMFTAHSNIS